MTRKKQQNLWNKIAYLFISFTIFVSINCYCSNLVVKSIKNGLTISNNVFMLSYIQNTGAAFSILRDYPYLLILLSMLALIFLFSFIIRHAGTMTVTGISWLSLMMSGIFCNLFERINLGYVRDYFSLTFVDFPIFNISDIAINISVIAIIFLLLKRAQLKQL